MRTTSFPLLKVTSAGFTDVAGHWRFLVSLLPIPLLVGFGIMWLADIAGFMDKPFLLVALKVPDNFITFIVMALFIRYLLLKEAPELATSVKSSLMAITRGSLIFTALSFVVMGILSILGQMMGNVQNPEEIDPSFFTLSTLGIAVIIWMFRYEWLAIAAAAGMPVRDFIKELGLGFGLSLRIFLLWILTSVPNILINTLVMEMIMIATHLTTPADLAGVPLWALLFISALTSFFTLAWQVSASIHAIRFCMQGK